MECQDRVHLQLNLTVDPPDKKHYYLRQTFQQTHSSEQFLSPTLFSANKQAENKSPKKLEKHHQRTNKNKKSNNLENNQTQISQKPLKNKIIELMQEIAYTVFKKSNQNSNQVAKAYPTKGKPHTTSQIPFQGQKNNTPSGLGSFRTDQPQGKVPKSPQNDFPYILNLLKRFLSELIFEEKFSFNLIEQLFQESSSLTQTLSKYRKLYHEMQEVMFGKDSDSELSSQVDERQHLSEVNCSIQQQKKEPFLDGTLVQDINNEQTLLSQEECLSPTNRGLSRSLVMDIECYSQDSKRLFSVSSPGNNNYFNFAATQEAFYYGQKQQYCSEYLTTSEDQKLDMSLDAGHEQNNKTKIDPQKLKILMLNEKLEKLKIHPRVAAFHIKQDPIIKSIPLQPQLREWKRHKNSILQEANLDQAIRREELIHPEDLERMRMKQHHYRQKIKSVIMKRKLTTHHFGS